jgi:hypothetical protein
VYILSFREYLQSRLLSSLNTRSRSSAPPFPANPSLLLNATTFDTQLYELLNCGTIVKKHVLKTLLKHDYELTLAESITCAFALFYFCVNAINLEYRFALCLRLLRCFIFHVYLSTAINELYIYFIWNCRE